MRKCLGFMVMALFLFSVPARADFFAIEIDAQAGYTWLSEVPHPTADNVKIKGGTFGVHGKLEILFIALMLDYQHFFENADLLHIGLGMDFKLDLSVIKPFVRGSAGLMMLYVSDGMLDPAPQSDPGATLGFQARAGLGLEVPLGDWFAVGAVADLGFHYLSTNIGYDLSAMGYLGLRI